MKSTTSPFSDFFPLKSLFIVLHLSIIPVLVFDNMGAEFQFFAVYFGRFCLYSIIYDPEISICFEVLDSI